MAPPLKIFPLCSLFLLWSCSAHTSPDIPGHIKALNNLVVYSPDVEPAYKITLEPEASFGDTEEVLLGPIILSTAVDDRERVYIADFRANTIHVYNPDGSYLQSIGREGRGPGEFQMLWTLRVSDEFLHVLDYIQHKISIFNLNTLQHETDISTSIDEEGDNKPSWINRTRDQGLFYKVTSFYIRPDNNYLVFFSEEDIGSAENIEGRTYEASVFSPAKKKYLKHDILSFEWSGRALTNGEVVITKVPYQRSSQFDYSNGQLVYGWTEELLFKFYDEDGNYQRAFYYPYSRAELKPEDALARYNDADEEMRKAIRSEMPETWPAFNAVVMDDKHRLWVSTFTDNQEVYEWWVLDQTGKLLAQFTWPRNRELKQVKNGFAYTLERSKETGLPKAVKYRIEMN